MILKSIGSGPLIWPSIVENRVTRPKKYSDLSATEALQADCDIKATYIILQGLPPEVYALVSNHKVAKELWERIQLLMQGTSLTRHERECKLYDEFANLLYKKEEAAVLRDLVDHIKANYPLDPTLESACKYTKLIQELLLKISKTCPSINNSGEQLVVVTPMNKNKKVRFTEPVTSSRNTITKKASTSNLASNKPMLSSTGVKPSTSASGSQPSGNTKKDKIQQTQSSTQKNKVEAHPRKVKSSLKNKDHVVAPKGTAHVQHSKLNANSELKCVKSSKLSSVFRLRRPKHKTGIALSSPISSTNFWVQLNSEMIMWQRFWDMFFDSNLEVAFRQHTCFIRNLEGDDLLIGSRDNNLYTLSLGDMMASSPICLLSKASKTKSWLWHRRLPHLKKKPYKPKSEDTNQEKLYLLHMDLCGPMRVASVNGKKSKDKAPDFIIKFLKMIQLRLKVHVRRIRTEFVNQTLREYYEKVGISYETSVVRSPQQNGVVEGWNRTVIEAAYTMLIYAKALLFLWAEVVVTACYTQNRSIIRLRHGKTPYELLHDKLPDLSFFYVFGALCYPTNDSENLGKLQPKADIVAAPEPVVSTGIPSSTTVDQDVSSPSNSQTTPDTQPPVIPNDVEEDNHDIEVAHMGNDLYFGIPILEVSSDQSSSSDSIHTIVHPDHQISEHNNKWTKDHPLENIIGELARPVSTRLQLHEQALFCYYDAFLTAVEPKTYKDALTQAC
ncbi:retrovirus-related pol polyprotein from transposon TNT 1-94 [Tanacetum coccineum]